MQMANLYPPRVQKFRDEMIDEIPRVPNDRVSRESLRVMPTNKLILAYITWRMRLIPKKPRAIRVWSGGVTLSEFQIAKAKLQPLLGKVIAGEDLTPHLSDLVNTKGIILPGAKQSAKRQDIDMVLTRNGLHHFHVGIVDSGNPKGRSGSLVFAEVLDKEFRIVAISDHRAFKRQSAEQSRFFRICEAYMAKDIPPGQGFMSNPVMSSGHSMLVMLFSKKCDDELRRLDPVLDDPAFIDKLYNDQPILRGGQPVVRPANPSMRWYFEDLRFGIVDTQTMVFFCILHFFAR